MVLRNRSGSERLTLSPARADLRIDLPRSEGRRLDETFRTEGEWLAELQDSGGLRVGRLAAIVYRVSETPEAAQELAEHFCKTELVATAPLNRTETFELHAHKRYETTFGVEVNSWVRNKSAKLAGGEEPVVLVEQDMNTLAELLEEKVFSSEEIHLFFNGVAAELDRTLMLYYPDVDNA